MNLYSFFGAKTVTTAIMMYKDGKVKNLKVFDSENGVTAVVSDLKDYGVIIRGLKTGWPTMICNCSMAKSGLRCMHMAAAAVAYNRLIYGVDSTESRAVSNVSDDSKKTEENKVKQLKPKINLYDLFPDINTSSTYYFDIQAMLRGLKSIPNSVPEEADRIIKKNKLTDCRFETYYANDSHFWNSDFQNGKITARAVDGNGKSIVLYFERDTLLRADCYICNNYYENNSYSSYRSRVCGHTIAMLAWAFDVIKKSNPGDVTDYRARNLLDDFNIMNENSESTAVEVPAVKKPDINIEPRVTRGDKGLELSFRLGRDKMYIMKNMTDFVKLVKNGEELVLGKNNILNFSAECFTEESEKWYEFIEKRVSIALDETKRINNENRFYYSAFDLTLKGTVDLSGGTLDEFYKLTEGGRVLYTDKENGIKDGNLKIGESELNLSIDLDEYREKDKVDVLGVSLTGVIPDLVDGLETSYCLDECVLAKVDPENEKLLRPFRKAAFADNSFRLTIGKKGMQDFYHRVLPMLESSPVITINNKVSEQFVETLPPEPVFTFFLDSDSGRFTCRCEVKYDDNTHEVNPDIFNDPGQEYRDFYAEERVERLLGEIFGDYSVKEKLYTLEIDDDSVYTILFEAGQEMMKYGEVKGTEAFNRMKVKKLPPVRVGVSVESDIMNLTIKSSELSDKELLEVLASYKKKKKYHRLKSGDFIGLNGDNNLELLDNMMESLNLSAKDIKKGQIKVPLYRALYVNRLFEEHNELAAERDRNFKKLIKNFKTIDESDFEIPAELEGVMRKYQEKGYKWLRTLSSVGFGGILADDMGLGKTLQAISVILAMKNEGYLEKPALIACPASLVYNWLEEFRRFAPGLSVKLIVGNQNARKELLNEESGYDVWITSYDLLKRDIMLYEDFHFSWMIIDEAQYIKSNNAAVTKAVKVVNAANRLALTGTPIENRLSELWSIFDFLMPGFLFGYEKFKSRFENSITKNRDEDVTEELKMMISPFILRRLKSDVLKDLPEKLEEVRYANFESEQQKVYDAQVTHMKFMIENSGPEDKLKVLAELMKIRQICCDPSLIFEDYKGESAKRDACMDLVKSAIDGGHRILLFSQFVSMLEILEKDLQESGIAYYKIVGATPKEERLKLVKAFNEDDTPVFIISLKAGGTGLNLVGADIVIHYDPWWNLAAQNQATDRAHRIGQTRKVTVFRLIVKNTIEEKILKLQEEKKNLADAVLSGETTSLGSLSKEELLELLG